MSPTQGFRFSLLCCTNSFLCVSWNEVKVSLCSLDPLVSQVVLHCLNVYSMQDPLSGTKMPEIVKPSNQMQLCLILALLEGFFGLPERSSWS